MPRVIEILKIQCTRPNPDSTSYDSIIAEGGRKGNEMLLVSDRAENPNSHIIFLMHTLVMKKV